MKFTGERYIPQEGWASIAYEHLGRYLFAEKLAEGKRVLDVGSGEGYGTARLAARAQSAVGIDVDPEAVEHAKGRYSSIGNLEYVESSALSIPFDARSFDLIVCFEMLEHIAEQDALVDELLRLLSDDGVLLISTPNKEAYSDAVSYENEFHVKELYLDEFDALLRRRFDHVKLFNQKNVSGCLIADLEEPVPTSVQIQRIRRKNSENEFEPVETESIDQMYYLAVCSKSEGALENCYGMVIADRDERMVREPGEREHAARMAERAETEELRKKEVEIAAIEAEAKALGSSLTAEIQLGARKGCLPVEPEQHLYDLVLPNFNSRKVVKICIDSLLEFTSHKHRIFIIDDASTDPEVGPMLAAYAKKWPHIHYHRLPHNLGFPGAVNTGLSMTDRDVVLINSDTEYSPNWLARMDRCRRSSPKIGTVTPLSNNATVCSVPQINEKNLLPEGMTVSELAEVVSRTSLFRYPRIPTGVGYCLLVTREMIDKVGMIDMTFGRGYGEEVDWCQRGWAAGFESVICDDAFVFHHGEVGHSEFAEMRTLQAENEKRVGERWPNYHRAVKLYCLMNPLRLQHQRIFEALRRPKEGGGRPKIMQVVHSFDVDAGTELHTRAVAEHIGNEFDCTVMFPREMEIWFDGNVEKEPSGLQKLKMNQTLVGADRAFRGAPSAIQSPMVERFAAESILGMGADVVHFQHLQNYGSMLLPQIARSLGAKVVITLHDYFLLCPDWNQMYPSGKMCGKDKMVPGPDCYRCMAAKMGAIDIAKHLDFDSYTDRRNRLVKGALEAAHVLIVPSRFVKDQFTRAHGEEVGRKIRVMPHGTKAYPYRKSYTPSEVLRVAFLGNLTEAKGRQIFLEAAHRLQDTNIQLQVMGNYMPGPDLKDVKNIEFSGGYRKEQLSDLLQAVDISFIGSVWNETYCYTVDESYRAGVPVIASDVGAISERVLHEQTGMLIPPGDSEALVDAILRIDKDRPLLERMRANVSALSLKTEEENLDEYAALYRELTVADGAVHQMVRKMMAPNATYSVPAPISLEAYIKEKVPAWSAESAEESKPAKPKAGQGNRSSSKKKKKRR